MKTRMDLIGESIIFWFGAVFVGCVARVMTAKPFDIVTISLDQLDSDSPAVRNDGLQLEPWRGVSWLY